MSSALKYTLVVALLFFLNGAASSTESIYTWTDKNGAIHMTNKQPPKGVTVEERIDYLPEQTDRTSSNLDNRPTEVTEQELDEAQAKAAQERQKAETARRRAQEAVDKARQREKEAVAYYEKTRNKSLKRKSLRIKIENQFQEVTPLKAEAERLNRLADEAEQRAKVAEEEVQKLSKPEK